MPSRTFDADLRSVSLIALGDIIALLAYFYLAERVGVHVVKGGVHVAKGGVHVAKGGVHLVGPILRRYFHCLSPPKAIIQVSNPPVLVRQVHPPQT